MSFTKWIALSGLVFVSPVVQAGTMTGVCNAEFAVKATMDSFVGHAKSEPASVDLAKDGKLTFCVGVTNMITGKIKRDEEMFRMFSATNFPVIAGAAKVSDLNALKAEAGKATLPIDVTIHGVTHSLTAQVSGLKRNEKSLAFDAAFTVPLGDFGLTPPSVMKIIRVSNDVSVIAHVALAQ